MDFSKFDKMVDNDAIKEQIESAADQDYDEVPAGNYMVSIEKMEIKQTKKGDKLMFAVQCKIKETLSAPRKQDGRWIFFNRIVLGNKVSEKWNDGRAIAIVLGWLKNITNDEMEFTTYTALSNDVEDIFNDICPGIELDVDYDPDAFNTIEINEVYDI